MLKGGGRFGIMHAMKGGCVCRQTYALAKSNESGGRKSRIRRSKEERKKMVESFIKKHQSLNSGNFPSLTLTHKEVGGSFYKIREIVGEIIQENRVLGPAKDLPEEQDADQLLMKNPSGAISTEPEASLSISPNGGAFVGDRDHNKSEEPNLICYGLGAEPERQWFDKEQVINGSHKNVTNKECDEIKVTKTQESEALQKEKVMEDVAASRTKVIEMADVIVETFPLRPVTHPINSLDGKYGEIRGLKEATVRKDVGKRYKEVENLQSPVFEGESCLVDEKAGKVVEDLPLNSFATKDGIVYDTQVDIDVEVKSSDSNKVITETKVITENKVIDASNGTQTETTVNGTHASTSSSEVIKEDVVGADVQHSGTSQKGNNPTLERINFKSWEETTKNTAESETNPVLAILKSFMAAFKKVWS